MTTEPRQAMREKLNAVSVIRLALEAVHATDGESQPEFKALIMQYARDIDCSEQVINEVLATPLGELYEQMSGSQSQKR